MNDQILNKVNLKNIHGYISSSSDDGSGCECKLELDEVYEEFQPPPILIDQNVHTIIKIDHVDKEDYSTTEQLLYSSVLKKNLALDECRIRGLHNEVGGGRSIPVRKKRKQARKKKKKSKTVQDFEDQNSVKVEEKVRINENPNDDFWKLERNEFSSEYSLLAENFEYQKDATIVTVLEKETFVEDLVSNRDQLLFKKPVENKDNINKKKCGNYFKKVEDDKSKSIEKITEVESIPNEEVVKRTKNKKKKKTKTKQSNLLPSEGCLLSMIDSLSIYQNYFPYGTSNLDKFLSFKEHFLNGRDIPQISKKISKIVRDYKIQFNLFFQDCPIKAFRLHVASQVFLTSLDTLNLKKKPLILICTLISKVAEIFENFSKSKKNLNYRNPDVLQNRCVKFNRAVDTAVQTVFDTAPDSDKYWSNIMNYSDPFVFKINRTLTNICTNFVSTCTEQLAFEGTSEYQKFNYLKWVENPNRNLERKNIEELNYQETEEIKLKKKNPSCQINEASLIHEDVLKNEETISYSQSDNQDLSDAMDITQNCLIDDMTQYKNFFYNFYSHHRMWQQFLGEYLNKDIISVVKSKNVNCNQTQDQNLSKTKIDTENSQVNDTFLVIEDMTENKKYYYDYQSNFNSWLQFRDEYLNNDIPHLTSKTVKSYQPVKQKLSKTGTNCQIDYTSPIAVGDMTQSESNSELVFCQRTTFDYPLIWLCENFDLNKIVTAVIFFIIVKNVILFVSYYIIMFFIYVAFNGTDIVFLILLLIYVCTIFVIKF